MSQFNIPRIDIGKTKEGKWFPFMNGVSFKIAKAGKEYMKALAQELREHKEIINDESENSKQKQREIVAELFAEYILFDWKGLKGEEGNGVPYSKEMVIAILSDEAYEHVYSFVSGKANQQSNYYEEQKKEDIKKS